MSCALVLPLSLILSLILAFVLLLSRRSACRRRCGWRRCGSHCLRRRSAVSATIAIAVHLRRHGDRARRDVLRYWRGYEVLMSAAITVAVLHYGCRRWCGHRPWSGCKVFVTASVSIAMFMLRYDRRCLRSREL